MTAHPSEGIRVPFRRRAFLWLWLGTVGLNTGAWAQLIGTQWLFVHDDNAASIMGLVQAVSTLPLLLLVLPAGVLADAFDRRILLVGVNAYLAATSTLLAAATFLGLVPPVMLLGFVFLINAGSALQAAAWQPLVAELVPRNGLAAATRLDMVSGNLGRMVGPLVAGALIAWVDVALVFAMNALCSLAFLVLLLLWGRPRMETLRRERFLPALRAGGRFVRHEAGVPALLIRLLLYTVPGSALWVALPLIAERQLGMNSTQYGALMSLAGLGAVLGALSLGWLRTRVSANRLVMLAAVVYGTSLVGTQLVQQAWSVALLTFLASTTWTATVSTLNSELQLMLPGWVRARALAMLSMVFAGSQAAASPFWGALIQLWGLKAVLAAAGLAFLGAAAGLAPRLRLREGTRTDHTPVAEWREAAAVGVPDSDSGPVVVCIEYWVPPEARGEFRAAMRQLRRARLRSGAHRWELYCVGEDPHQFVELVTVDSWDALTLQHERTRTVADRSAEQAVARLSASTPRRRHLLPPHVGDEQRNVVDDI